MNIEFNRKFKKKYKKLDDKIKKKFEERLGLFMKGNEASILRLHQLKGYRKGQWSMNVTADWRAIFIYQDKDTVIFLDIGTHSELYN